MKYYPVFLDLCDRPCLVIGEGELTDQKAAGLERSGARVFRSSRFKPEEALEVFLIVAVLEGEAEIASLRSFAEQNRILLNVVDRADYCDFIAPAVMEREDLIIAISTSGKSPAMAVHIRRQLEDLFGTEYGELLKILGEIRPQVQQRFHSFEERKVFYESLIEGKLLGKLDKRDLEGVRKQIARALHRE